MGSSFSSYLLVHMTSLNFDLFSLPFLAVIHPPSPYCRNSQQGWTWLIVVSTEPVSALAYFAGLEPVSVLAYFDAAALPPTLTALAASSTPCSGRPAWRKR